MLYEGDELKILDKSTGEDFVKSISLFSEGWGVSIKDSQVYLNNKDYTFIKISAQHDIPKSGIEGSSKFSSPIVHTIDEYKESGLYSADQLEQIELGIDSGVDISLYSNPKFDDLQMEQIRLGILELLDVSKYAYSKFNYAQMEEIRLGLRNDLDIRYYADRKFSYEQMRQIRLGLLSGINILYYADNKYSPPGNVSNKIKTGVLPSIIA